MVIYERLRAGEEEGRKGSKQSEEEARNGWFWSMARVLRLEHTWTQSARR